MILAIPLRKALHVSVAFVALGAVSCSSLRTIPSPKANEQFITYYLPKPVVQVDIYEETLGNDTPRYHVRVVSVPVPDLQNPQRMVLDHSVSTRDQLQVSLSPGGLLEHVRYDRYPRGADAVVAVGQAAMKVASMLGGVPLKGDGAPPELSRLVAREVYDLSDLLASTNGDPHETRWITNPGGQTPFQIVFTKPVLPPSTSGEPNCANGTAPAFYYHRLTPVEVRVQEEMKDKAPTPVNLNSLVYVPDPRNRGQYWIPTSTIARQSYDFRFTGGTLTDVAVRQESGLLTVAEIPGRILGVVTGLPAQLLSVTVTHEVPPEPNPFSGDDKGPGRGDPRDLKQ